MRRGGCVGGGRAVVLLLVVARCRCRRRRGCRSARRRRRRGRIAMVGRRRGRRRCCAAERQQSGAQCGVLVVQLAHQRRLGVGTRQRRLRHALEDGGEKVVQRDEQRVLPLLGEAHRKDGILFGILAEGKDCFCFVWGNVE